MHQQKNVHPKIFRDNAPLSHNKKTRLKRCAALQAQSSAG
jgi:hypothetical protein